MPPKTTFTKDDVLNAAFALVEKNGLKELTARNVAAKLGSSTAPVYSYYKSIDKLEKEVVQKTVDLVLEYARKQYTNINFLNVGVGIASFAKEHRMLYHSLFMEKNNYTQVLKDLDNEIIKDISNEPYLSELSHFEKISVLMKMGIFSHGLGSLICVEHLTEFSEEDIVKMLYDVGFAVIADALHPHKQATMKSDGKGGYLFEC